MSSGLESGERQIRRIHNVHTWSSNVHIMIIISIHAMEIPKLYTSKHPLLSSSHSIHISTFILSI